MAQLTTDGIFYHVDGQRIDDGMTVQRQDKATKEWAEGKIYMNSGLFYLHPDGAEPVPLQVGDTIRIVTAQELYNREEDKRNRMAPKYGSPGYDGEETRSFDSSNEGW